jgi:hypothetical protein
MQYEVRQYYIPAFQTDMPPSNASRAGFLFIHSRVWH